MTAGRTNHALFAAAPTQPPIPDRSRFITGNETHGCTCVECIGWAHEQGDPGEPACVDCGATKGMHYCNCPRATLTSRIVGPGE